MNISNMQSVRGGIALKKLCATIALVSWSAVMMPSAQATVLTLSGGDPGEGYAPLTNTIYAYYFTYTGYSQLTYTIQGVPFQPFKLFTPTTAIGSVTIGPSVAAYPSGSTPIGGSANDLALQGAMSQVFFYPTPWQNHGPMNLTIGGLQDGHDYQLDLLWGTSYSDPATYTITAANGTFVENIPGVGHTYYDAREIVYSSGGQITIVATNQLTDPDAPYLSGFSITEVPEPTATLLASLGVMLMAIQRRRSRA